MIMEEQTWIMATLAALFAVSEALAYIDAVKSNGIFQSVQNVLKSLMGKK
jgi:hypothetical protein